MGVRLTLARNNFHLAQGLYRAEVVSIEPAVGWEGRPELCFEFKVTEEPFLGVHCRGWVGAWLTNKPECRLRAWLYELLEVPVGEDLPIGYEFNGDDLTGTAVQVWVEAKKSNGKPIVRDLLRASCEPFIGSGPTNTQQKENT